jgi:hypothetical protein
VKICLLGYLILLKTTYCEVGDQVWIIRDALTPIVLRPVADTGRFTLVGEAHVDSVMFGEALAAESCPDSVPVTIA